MRLAQFARKYGITQSEIVELLNKNEERISENGNSKLSQAQETLLMNHYGLEESLQESEPVEDNVTDSDDYVTNESEMSEIYEQEVTLTTNEISTDDEKLEYSSINNEYRSESDELDTENEEVEPLEIIRAKKVKLDGIKVVGKIELPAVPDKESDAEKDNTTGTAQNKAESRDNPQNKKRLNSSQKKRKSLSYEEKQKREALRLKRKKEEREKVLKEKKKQHYFENIQPKTKPSKTRVQKKTKEVESVKKDKPTHRNPIRKFWAWLNGEYDQ